MSDHTGVLDVVNQHAASASVSTGLVAAGIVPSFFGWFTTEHLQYVYFCVILPPAIYHLYAWFKTTFWDDKMK